jgi:urease accessory protein
MHRYGLLHLLQLADSAFPTGMFAHSFGLETLIQEEWLGGARHGLSLDPEQALFDLTSACLATELGHTDLPILFAAFGGAAEATIPTIATLHELACAAKPVREWREAGARSGQRLLAAVNDFAPTPFLMEAARAMDGGPQICVAFAVAAQQLGCAVEETAQAYAVSASTSRLAAAVRLGIIGQRSMQRLVHRLKPHVIAAVEAAATIRLEDIGGSVPILEIAGMRHEYAEQRLFIS